MAKSKKELKADVVEKASLENAPVVENKLKEQSVSIGHATRAFRQ
jgi:hypothetical protein